MIKMYANKFSHENYECEKKISPQVKDIEGGFLTSEFQTLWEL